MNENLVWVELTPTNGEALKGKLDVHSFQDPYLPIQVPLEGKWRVIYYTAGAIASVKLLDEDEIKEVREEVAAQEKKEDAWQGGGSPHERKTFGLAKA